MKRTVVAFVIVGAMLPACTDKVTELKLERCHAELDALSRKEAAEREALSELEASLRELRREQEKFERERDALGEQLEAMRAADEAAKTAEAAKDGRP